MIENIILDLDETLIHTTMEPTNHPNFRARFRLSGTDYYLHTRPGLTEFLDFVFTNFKTVNIWTAATKDYAIQIINKIMTKEQRQQLKFFNTRTHIVNGTKPLKMLFSNDKAKELGIFPNNTLMIDDKDSIAIYNPGNAIIVPKWDYPNLSVKDQYLLKLIIVLKGIKAHKLLTDPSEPYLELKKVVG